MDGWMDGWMDDGWMDRWVAAYIRGWGWGVNGWKARRLLGRVGEWVSGQVAGRLFQARFHKRWASDVVGATERSCRIDESGLLGAPRSHWTHENYVLEVPGSRWIDENSPLEAPRSHGSHGCKHWAPGCIHGAPGCKHCAPADADIGHPQMQTLGTRMRTDWRQ